MRFSNRVPPDLAPNRFAQALARARVEKRLLLDLTVSNPTDVGIEYPRDLLAALATPDSLRYDPQPFGLLSARQAVVEHFRQRGVRTSADRVVLTASTSEAYSVLFKLLCDAGDAVLVPRPSYPLFDHLTRLDAVQSDSYPLEYHGRWSVDVDSLRRAVTPRTRAVLAVSPNNPTGSFLDARDLAAVSAVCAEHGLALIGDEVFAEYRFPWAPADAPSVLDLADILVFGLGGLSKSAGLPQLKLGWIGVSGPSGEVGEALARLEVICDSYLSVGTPVQQAAGVLLARAGAMRDGITARVLDNHQRLARLAAQHPACSVLNAEGGWYAIVQVPATRSEEDLVVAVLERDNVVVYPGYFFDFAREAFVVVSLLPRPEVFEQGIECLLQRATGSDA